MAKIGGWRALDLRGYVDLTQEVDRDVDNRLIETELIDSEPEDELQHLGAVSAHRGASRTFGVSGPRLFWKVLV